MWSVRLTVDEHSQREKGEDHDWLKMEYSVNWIRETYGTQRRERERERERERDGNEKGKEKGGLGKGALGSHDSLNCTETTKHQQL